MKIAFVVDCFPSMSETFILSQMTWLVQAGHDVRIFAVKKSRETLTHPDVERFELIRRTRYARTFRGGHHRRQVQLGTFLLGQVVLGKVSAGALLAGYERSGPPALPVWTYPRGDAEFDVILAHFGPNGVHAMEMRKAGVVRGRLVTAFHGYDMKPEIASRHRCYTRLFEEGDLFLPVSEYFRSRLLHWGAVPERTVVHHMGIDPERFAFTPRTAPDNRLELISIARLVPKKGLEYAIQAAAALGSSIRYTIIGDGPERRKLEALIARLGAHDSIQLAGWQTQDRVADRLRSAHVMLAPSVTTDDGEEEGIPVAIMEAMATGLPVITTRHSGIPELVEDGVSGYLCGEREVDPVADRLRSLLQSPEQLTAIGRAARTVVEQRFNNHMLHPRLLELVHAAA
jgi:colanic acid/amylovoran biosynthesis glycosyltransferase